MNSKEVKVKLIGGMENTFADYRFLYNKKELANTRKFDGGQQDFYFLINENSGGV